MDFKNFDITKIDLKESWWLTSKESASNAGHPVSILGSARPPGGGNGNTLQYSCLGNPMDRETWQTVVDGAARVGYHLETKPPKEKD